MTLKAQQKKTDKSLSNLSATAKKFGNQALDLAKGAIAVNSAISAMVLVSAKSRKNLELLSKQAKVSTEDFQALAFSTSQFGVNAEQIADISKDIADKVGEFSAAGTGAFQDYADVIKLTKEEAQQAAIEFQGLSSQEILGKMVSEMEKVNATGDQMTFVLESMGNDLSKLQPLFANNSAELDKLKDRFKAVNDELQITDVQAEKLKEVSTSFELMTTQIGNAATAISATLAPVMDDFFNDVISVVPDATQTIIDFANSFLDAENISSIAGVNTQIQESQARIIDSQKKINDLKKASNSYSKDGGEFNVRAQRQLEEAIESERVRTAELNDQLEVLNAQNKALDDANKLKGGEIGGETGGVVPTGVGTGDQIQAIADRFKDETTLLEEKFAREIELIGENDQLKLELREELIYNLQEIEERAEEDRLLLLAKTSKKEDKIAKDKANTEKKIESQKLALAGRTAQTLLATGISSQQKLFSIVKDGAASQIEAYGLTAGAKALAELGPIAGPPVAASYIGWSQVAAGVVRAMPIGGGGGGSSPTNSGGGSSSESTQPQQQDFQEQTSSLELTDSSAGGSQTTALPFATDSGDEIMDVIARLLNERQELGRT
jgi:hypothetical protein